MELVVTKRTTEDMELVAPKARKLLITAPGRKAGAEGYGAVGNDNNYGVYGAGGAKGYEALQVGVPAPASAGGGLSKFNFVIWLLIFHRAPRPERFWAGSQQNENLNE